MPRSGEPRLPESHDFSLVLGGPLHQFFRRSRLARGALELLHRRTIVSLSGPILPTTLSLETLLGKVLKMPF
jgi:hypothetical protein